MDKIKKKVSKKKEQLGIPAMLIIDLISLIFSLLPNLIALGITLSLFLYSGLNLWLTTFISPFVLFFSFIATIFILRMCLPKLKPGRYKREINKNVISWFCHFALGRAAKLSGLIRFLQAFNITKFLYWRALGAKVSFFITCSYDIDFVDCPLISIGKNVTLGSATNISCHSDIGGCLILGPVVIEDNVFISMSNVIGPNTTIKNGAWIGFGNALVNQVIEENEKLRGIKPE
jgi:acetyltransferase-like isoleucine patch superfamily enzyme